MGEDHQGRDPWIVDLPSEGDDYHRFNVRIVDPGTEVGRELVRNVARLMRPCGERIEISYLLFLDRFATDRDNIQWEDEPTVEDGVLKLEDTGSAEGVRVAGDAALAWSNYSVYWRIKGATEADYLCSFYWTDEDNFYQVRVNLAGATTRLILRKVVAGAGSTLVNLPLPMNTNEWLGIRVAIQRSGGTNLIRVYLDGDLQIDTTDPDHTAGKVGFGHWAGGSMQCDEVEVFPIPMDTDTVDINPS